MKKTVLGLVVGGFLAGGLVGRELERGRPFGLQQWVKGAKAAQPLRPTQIMKYGFPSNTDIKVGQFLILLLSIKVLLAFL